MLSACDCCAHQCSVGQALLCPNAFDRNEPSVLFLSVSFRCLQPSARDVSAHISRKSAAKCDKHCDLQNSVNHENLECALRSQGFPGSMPASVFNHFML